MKAEPGAFGVSTEQRNRTSLRRRLFDLTPRQWALCIGLLVLTLASGWSIRGSLYQRTGDWEIPNMLQAAAQKKYPFDLSTCLIPKEAIRSGGPAPDGIPALTRPPVLSAAKASSPRAEDRVIGVKFGSEARAYPLRILNWHENVNDVLDGRPIAVTYCPLCDSAAVFDRKIGGQVREFGISGLLYNSNVLLFDRQPSGQKQSLWSQLQMRAVAGPAAKAGLTLTALPCELSTWSEWISRHPQTTVLSTETGYPRDYGYSPYEDYFRTDRLMFPVSLPAQRPAGLRIKEPLIVVRIDQAMRAYPVKTVAQLAGSSGWFEDKIDGRPVRLEYSKRGDSVRVAPADGAAKAPAALYTFWFAWQAMFPEGTLFEE